MLAFGSTFLEIGCCEENDGRAAFASRLWIESEYYLRQAQSALPEDVEILEWLLLALLKQGKELEAASVCESLKKRACFNKSVRDRCENLLASAGSPASFGGKSPTP